MFKIDLLHGTIVSQYNSPLEAKTNPAPWPWGTGFASTPAVVDGRLYCTILEGVAICLDANDLSHVLWRTNLAHLDIPQRQ